MNKNSELIVCVPKALPSEQLAEAARIATEINPVLRAFYWTVKTVDE